MQVASVVVGDHVVQLQLWLLSSTLIGAVDNRRQVAFDIYRSSVSATLFLIRRLGLLGSYIEKT